MEKVNNVKAHQTYRTKDGTKVPGVTTVLGVLAKPALIHWAWKLGMDGVDYRKYRDKMASIGTLAHYMVESDLKTETPDLESYSAEEIKLAENALISYWEWHDTYNPTLLESEIQLVSEKHRYGGTIDLYCEIHGVPTLVDFKTGKAVYPEMITQLAAYRQLLIENGYPVKKVQLLRIGRDESEHYDLKANITAKHLQPHWKKFKACLTIYEQDKLIKKEDL